LTISDPLNSLSKSQGIAPDIVPSTFEEDLDFYQFSQAHEYPVATATHKAVQVYEKLVVGP
jgi:septum formation protein